ncbi:hypothetical protein [Mycobacterium decipiens]|uniref:hypothetical protein n=1 Tax=Mycobacterium decipiens TaxID=1430326 RepID=UPI001A986EE5|nr:hypothetical protein [Mycobacterium decipiens]
MSRQEPVGRSAQLVRNRGSERIRQVRGRDLVGRAAEFVVEEAAIFKMGGNPNGRAHHRLGRTAPRRQSHALGEIDGDAKFNAVLFEDVEVLIANDVKIRLQAISHPVAFEPFLRE